MKNFFLVVCVVVFFLGLVGNGYALIVTETQVTNAVDGMNGLQFDVYNDVNPDGQVVNAGVYSYLIGASEPAGVAWAGGVIGWNGETVNIAPYDKQDGWGNHTIVYRVYEPGEGEGTLLFELTDSEWANYSHGYFYWAFDQQYFQPYGYRQLMYGHRMTVYAITDGEASSPFAYTNFKINFDGLPAQGYTPTGYGQTRSPVPLPGALWLLGSGLFGLVAGRRRQR